MSESKTALQKYDEKSNVKDCTLCKKHITRKTPTGIIHFCGVTEKLLLYPDYLPNNCENYL